VRLLVLVLRLIESTPRVMCGLADRGSELRARVAGCGQGPFRIHSRLADLKKPHHD